MSYGLKETADATNPFDLTRLELIGLTLAANGLATSEIASRLSLSEAEIEMALDDARRKLDARNRAHAVTIAVRKGLIGIEAQG